MQTIQKTNLICNTYTCTKVSFLDYFQTDLTKNISLVLIMNILFHIWVKLCLYTLLLELIHIFQIAGGFGQQFELEAERILLDRREYFSRINVNISWSIIEDTQSIYIEIIAPIANENGWFAIGFSENSGMKGADIGLISLYDKKIYDLNSNDFELPKMDKIQDWKLENLIIDESNGVSIATIKRYLMTCDSQDYRIKTNPFHDYVLIAYNEYDDKLIDTTDSLLSISIHPYKETKELNLFLNEDLLINSDSTEQDDEGGSIDYLMNNATIDVSKYGATQYFCTMFNITSEYNISGAEPIDGTNNNIVHHLQFLQCDDTMGIELINNQQQEAHYCALGTEFDYTMSCRLKFSLTRSTSITLPPTMYYNIEPGIYMVEIHYDVYDYAAQDYKYIDSSSGVRLHTIKNEENNRANEISVFKINVDDTKKYSIPSNKKEYQVSMAMNSDCINNFLPDDGIDIVLIGGHMHYLGTRLKLERIRHGPQNNQIVTIFELNHWDFDRQFAHRINYHINKNDTLRLHCWYDSRDTDSDTYFGFETTDEMCQVYIGYTPKIDNLTTVVAKPMHSGKLGECYCGGVQVEGMDQVDELGLQSFVFENTQNVGVNYVRNGKNTKFMDETDKLCQEIVFSKVDLTRNKLIWNVNQNFMSLFAGVFILISIFICLGIIEWLTIKFKLINPNLVPANIRRKVNIYILSVVFFTIMLILLLLSTQSKMIMRLDMNECDLTYTEKIDEELIDHTYIIAVSNCLVVFYSCELFYREHVKWDLFLHHIFTICIILTLQTGLQYTMNVKTLFMLGYYYLLQIGTEQPLFIALLAKRLDLDWMLPKYYATLFHFSSIWHYITKIGTTIMIMYVFIGSLTNCDDIFYIYNVSYEQWLKDDNIDMGQLITTIMFILTPLLFILQMYQGIIFWRIGNNQMLIQQLSREQVMKDPQIMMVDKRVNVNSNDAHTPDTDLNQTPSA